MIQLNQWLLFLADGESEIPINEQSFLDKLIPNWTSFVTQLAALIIMIIIVIILGYKPVKKMLKKRQDYVEASIRDAELAKAQSEANLIQAKEAIIASQNQAKEIIQVAKNNAELLKKESLEETNNQIAKMKNDAQEDINRSKQEALDEIHDEMVSIALSASSEILKREINEKDNASIVEDFIKDIN